MKQVNEKKLKKVNKKNLTVICSKLDGFLTLSRRSSKNRLFLGMLRLSKLPINSLISDSVSIFKMFLKQMNESNVF